MVAKIIGIIGALAGIASAFLPYGKLVFKKFGEDITKVFGGLDLIQGQVGLGLAIVSLLLIFIRPKLAIVTGVLMMGAGVWFYVAKVLDSPIKPAFGVWAIILGGLFVVIASVMSPKK